MEQDALLIFTVFIAAVLFLAFVFLIGKLLRVKKQLKDVSEILDDIRAGNGNRKILAYEKNIVAPLAYQMNDIVYSYEEQIMRLKQADETNRQLMTSLSHDVRTPLTTLIGYLDAVHKGSVLGDMREDYIETAQKKAHDLKDYIDVLFDWFKLNSNELTMSIQPVEIAELTRNILKDWIPIFEEHGMEYEIEIPEQRLMAKIDIDAYCRIINNLVQNVISHSNASKIGIIILHKANILEILISDNGCGIDKQDLQHIFERLYKCDKARSKKGSGLGLSIVKQMVEKMHGTITANSKLGEGTEFAIRLSFAD